MEALTCHDSHAGNVKSIPPAVGKKIALLDGWLGYGDKTNNTNGYGDDRDKVEYPWPARVLNEDRSDDQSKHYNPGRKYEQHCVGSDDLPFPRQAHPPNSPIAPKGERCCQR